MKKKRFILQAVWFRLVLGAALIISLAAGPAMGAQDIDPDADRILKSMSTFLGGAKAFSMNADIDLEVVAQNGQKLQLSSYSTIVMERPAKFFITRKGVMADAQVIYDGKTLTLYGKNLNAYAQVKVPGTIDDAIIAYEQETGIPAPGADLLFADSYLVLSSGIENGIYVGTAYVNGFECHHLAFREAMVDWQLWVRTGDEPLPMKYVITTKWHTGAPQYEIRLRDWDMKPEIKADQFSFSAPAGAANIDTIATEWMKEFISTEEDK
jgi:hypothetical protein